MDFPSSKLTKPIRRAFMLFFIMLFFIISPIIILHTSGYRYDWKYGLLKETGAINIDVEPSNASIYINNIKIQSKMPVRLNDRVPNKYNILITAPGYYDWQKDIEVKNKQTIYVKGISLLKKNEPSLIIGGNIKNLTLSYNSRYLIYIKEKNKLTEVWLKNLSGDQAEQNILSLPGEQELKIIWTKNNYFFTVSAADPPYNFVYLVNAEQPDRQFDLIKKIKYPVEQFQWKESGEPELFFSTKLKIMSILPRTEQQYIKDNNKYIDWYMENGQLWTLQAASDTDNIKIICDTLGSNYNFQEKNTISITEQKIRFVAAESDRIILKKIDLPEMMILTKNNKYTITGEKFIASQYNNWWLIWTPWEIWTHSKNEEPNLLNRSGEQLQKIVPLDRYNTLALIWSDKTTALFPYYLVNHDLLNYKIKDAAADPKKKIFYFIAEINNQNGLWQLTY